MQGGLRQHFVDLGNENKQLQAEVERLKRQKAFLSTKLFDAKYAIKQMKLYINKNHKLTFWQKIAVMSRLKMLQTGSISSGNRKAR